MVKPAPRRSPSGAAVMQERVTRAIERAVFREWAATGYAALYAQTYGEAVDAMTLIPHMLEAFMAGDRGFRRGGREAPKVAAK